MSRLWSAIFSPATARSVARAGSPSTMSEMSVLVPPMSNGMRLPSLISADAEHAAGDPAGRPRQHGPGGHAHRLRDRRHAAVRLHDEQRARVACRLEPLRQARQVAVERRPDVGVHDRGADALVLLDLREDLRRQRHVDAGQRPGQRLARRPPRAAGRGRRGGSTPPPPPPPRASAAGWPGRASGGPGGSPRGRRPGSARARRPAAPAARSARAPACAGCSGRPSAPPASR